MMNKGWILFCSCVLLLAGCTRVDYRRWSEEKANAWAEEKGWAVGCNYVTATAINQIEMWQAETFDPETIGREMGLAEDLGFNTVRVFLSFLVYQADPKGFMDRFETFLKICSSHGIRVLPTFWTNGGKLLEPMLGPQPDPVPGVHNSGWVMNPGPAYVNDPSKWPELEKMVKGVIRAHRDDDRILMWCLYNEPENHRHGVENSVPLMKATFEWARECRPSQPLTSPIMSLVGSNPKYSHLPEASFVLENSDVLSFHCYHGPERAEAFITSLLPYGRPMICTEYMARPRSTFFSDLPVYKKYGVGAISFGLTAGKGNFNYPWNEQDENGNSIPWEGEPEIWFHDIFRLDGTPYDTTEVAFLRRITRP